MKTLVDSKRYRVGQEYCNIWLKSLEVLDKYMTKADIFDAKACLIKFKMIQNEISQA